MGLKEPNLDKVVNGIDELSKNYERILKKKVGLWARKVKVQQEMLIPVDSGDLRQGQKERRIMKDNKLNIKFYNKEPYATYVEFGTGPVGQANQPTVIPDGLALVYRDTGWVFPYEGKEIDPSGKVASVQKFAFTMGLPARQFFYPPIFNHIDELKKIIKEAQREAVKTYLQSKK